MEDKWIPVTGRMPESGMHVLTCDGFGHIDIMYRSSTFHAWVYGAGMFTDSMYKGSKSEIKAWRPLPEPYKEDA